MSVQRESLPQSPLDCLAAKTADFLITMVTQELRLATAQHDVRDGGGVPEARVVLMVRGLPGSGKATFATTVLKYLEMVVAEEKKCMLSSTMAKPTDFFAKNTNGAYFRELLPHAHNSCLAKISDFFLHLQSGRSAGFGGYTLGIGFALSSFAKAWEAEKYRSLCQEQGASLLVVSIFDGGTDNDATLAARTATGSEEGIITYLRNTFEHGSLPLLGQMDTQHFRRKDAVTDGSGSGGGAQFQQQQEGSHGRPTPGGTMALAKGMDGRWTATNSGGYPSGVGGRNGFPVSRGGGARGRFGGWRHQRT